MNEEKSQPKERSRTGGLEHVVVVIGVAAVLLAAIQIYHADINSKFVAIQIDKLVTDAWTEMYGERSTRWAAEPTANQSKLESAKFLLDLALRYDNEHTQALTYKSMYYRNIGNSSNAIELVQRSLEIESSAISHNLLGNLLSDRGDHEQGAGRYREAVDDDEQAAEHYRKAKVAYEQAVIQYEKAISLDDSVAIYYDNLGLSLLDLKRYDEAKARFRRALELDPGFSFAYMNLALAFHGSRQFKEYKEYLRLSIETDPENTLARKHLCYFEYSNSSEKDKMNIETSFPCLEKAFRADRDSFEFLMSVGDLFRSRGQEDQARRAYEMALEKNPNSSNANRRISEFYVRDNKDNREYLNRASFLGWED